MKLHTHKLILCFGALCTLLFLSACELKASTPPAPTATPQNALTVAPTFRPLSLTMVAPGTPGAVKSIADEAAAATQQAEAAQATPAPTKDKSSPIMGQHTVRAGETLYSIGRAYGVSPVAIAETNHLAEPYTIYPGNVLDIPRVRWPGGVPPGPTANRQFEPDF